MNYFAKILEQKNTLFVLSALTLIGAALRLFVVINWMDIPGDGPTRAAYAYNWYVSPSLDTYGIWLPGFKYLTGIFTYIVPDPLFSIRIMNWIMGTLSILVFYYLVRRVQGHIAALFGAGVLAFFPLHIGLSASSLTEVSFIFETMLGIHFLIKACEDDRRNSLYLCISIFFILIASMTRYEGWLFLPFLVFYYYWKTKKIGVSLLLIAICALLPGIWMMGNHLYAGDFLLGIQAAKDVTWSKQVSLSKALEIIGRLAVEQFEWPLFLLIVIGVLMQLRDLIKKRLSWEQILLFIVTFIFWAVMVRFGMVRGDTLQPRVLLFGMVLMLPFAALPFRNLMANDGRLLTLAFLFFLVTFIIPSMVHWPIKDVTRTKPEEIKRVAMWLKNNVKEPASVLLTAIDGQATYLPLYFKEIGPHDKGHFIYFQHVGMSDARLKEYLINHKPAIFITCDKDAKLKSDIEAVWEQKIASDEPVHKEGKIKIYIMASRD